MSFDELRAFLEVARRGSFQAAARALGASRTTLRRQVDALEARAGTELLTRTQTGVFPTESGKRLMESGARLQRDFSSLLASVRESRDVPAGELEAVFPIGLHPMSVGFLVQLTRDRWRELKVSMCFHESPFEADLPGTEVVVSFGNQPPPEGWISQVIARVPVKLLAAKSYLDVRGEPKTVSDLSAHDLLYWAVPGESGTRLRTRDGFADVHPLVTSTDPHVVHVMAHQGLGIGYVLDAGLPPMYGFEPLVPVLADRVAGHVEVRAATHPTVAELPRVRAVLAAATDLMSVAGLGDVAIDFEEYAPARWT